MMNGLDKYLSVLIIAALFGFLVFLITVIILKLIYNEKMICEKRILKLFGSESTVYKDNRTNKTKRKKEYSFKFSKALTEELQMANIPMRSEEFAIFWILIVFVPAGITAVLSRDLVISIVVTACFCCVPMIYVKNKKKNYIIQFEDQLSDALVVMCNCLRSGLTLNQAMENIATEMSDPISKEFFRVCTEIKYGTSIEVALNNMTDRIKSEDLSLAVSAINIQRQVGGNLSNVLSSISETIKARIKLKREIKVLTATGRASGIVISVLPIGMGILLSFINPDYMKLFFENTLGKGMLLSGAIMEIIGILIVKKIVTIKY